MADNPYSQLEDRAFWRRAVADAGILGLSDLWRCKFDLPARPSFATYGSCFAQHISRAVQARGLPWVDAEPAPAGTPEHVARAFNYGVFSARTANIYTTPQFQEWVRLASDPACVEGVELWEEGGRYRDCLRPLIEPEGFSSIAEARQMLATTARAVRMSVETADVVVFTLGLTEGWEHRETGQIYALCPGTQAGRFDPDVHVFRNYDYPASRAALEAALDGVWRMNPSARVLLTVSPVPLVATASGDHVLSAVGHAKAILRAVAGDLSHASDKVDYFPSYELIAGAPSRAMFFAPDLRSVAAEGVALVMEHVFAGLGIDVSREPGRTAEPTTDDDLVCDERILERYEAD